MVRNYVLLMLMMSIFLPEYLNSAALEPQKPTILIIDVSGLEDFGQAIRKLAEPKFEVRIRNHNNVYPADLMNVKYVLIDGWLEDHELLEIPDILGEMVLKQPNKTLVIWQELVRKPIKIDSSITKLFNGQVFVLNIEVQFNEGKVVKRIIENERSNQFIRWFTKNILEEQFGVPSLGQEKINPQLLQRLEKFDKELQRLNQEFTEIKRLIKE